MDSILQLFSSIKHITLWGYLLIFLLSFFESFAFIGLIIPGSIALIIAGFLVAQGVIDLGDLFVWAALGAILGDSFSFWLGKRGAIAFRPENKVFKPELLSKGRAYFEKHGARSVFFGRFIGWVRPIIPFVAGIFKLNWKSFLVWNILSGLLWAASHIAVGYFFGQGWQLIDEWSTRISVFVVTVALVLIVFYLLKWLIIKKGKQLFGFLASIWRSVKQAIVENTDVQRFAQKHARLFRWLKQRFERTSFLGLPTTLLLIALVYILSFLGGIIEDVISSDLIVAADIRIANLLAVFRGVHLTKVFLWITLLGKWQIVLIFLIATTILLWLWRKRAYIVPLFITIIGSEIFVYLGKFIIHRSRPDVALYTEHTFSFPSGHATIAVAFYGFIAYILIKNSKKWKRKVNIFFAGLLIILLIGFSRLYLGVHYVSDIWGGYLVGALWLIIGISISEWFYARRGDAIRPTLPKHVSTVSITVIVAALLLYGCFARSYNPIPEQPVVISNPAVIEEVDAIFTNEQLKYTETLIGSRQEPLNFVITASDDQNLVNTFSKAGWYLGDSVTPSSMARFFEAALLKKRYLQAPMTPSFWNAQVHDFGFEKSTEENQVRMRHHARFWKTNYITETGDQVYVGTASLDVGLKWGGIAHTIDPAIDTEREFLFNDLLQSEATLSYVKQNLVRPILGENFSGDQFFTDGQFYNIVFH